MNPGQLPPCPLTPPAGPLRTDDGLQCATCLCENQIPTGVDLLLLLLLFSDVILAAGPAFSVHPYASLSLQLWHSQRQGLALSAGDALAHAPRQQQPAGRRGAACRQGDSAAGAAAPCLSS